MSRPANPVTLPLADYSPKHFLLAVVDGVATVTLNRPERKNPLTFESYRELTDFFRACAMDDEVKTIVVSGAGGNFSSGGDVFEIIGPLVQMDTKGLTAFTRMTGDLVKAMRACPQPIVAAVEGICAGAGAIIAMASDMRLAATGAKVAFLFNKVGLAGCDMGACAILPRIIGQSRASELLYTGRFMTAEEGERWGFFSRIVAPEQVLAQAQLLAKQIAEGPDLRQHHDQAHAGDGMGDVGGGGDRGRSGGAGAVHDHGGFCPRVRGVFATSGRRCFRGIEPSRHLQAERSRANRGLAGEEYVASGLAQNCFRLKVIRTSRQPASEALMKIAIIGGGPAGLYAAILLKKQRPQAEITVYERNRADDTFGFGVVFSDATLDNFEKYDPPSYRRITQEFAYWDDIAVHFRGTVHRVGGNGFCGCSRRTLLLILQERARELGVTLLFETDIDDEAPLCRCRSDRARRRHQQPLPRQIHRSFPARGRPALQQVRLDGLDQAARCLHLHLPGDRVGPVHRARLSI